MKNIQIKKKIDILYHDMRKKIFVDMHMYEMKKINTTYSIYETCWITYSTSAT